MNDALPTWPIFLAFLAASFVLAVTPGPGVFYIVTRSLTQGKVSGLASVVGVALGNLGNAIAASIGLAAILSISSIAFTVIKYAGAAYLIYLGIQALRNVQRPAASDSPPAAPSRVFLDGFIVALLNPKTALFFGAFLPQFMSAGSTPILQSLVLGASFVAIAATTDTVYALAAATIAPALASGQRFRAGGRYFTGGALVGLGLFTAFSDLRTSK
jgi:threonine/homoserine/homoserine lactone efflux protein